MRLGWLVPAGFLTGAWICRFLLRVAPPDVAVDRAQPLTVVTYWQHFGGLMWLSLAVAIVIASIGYIAALRVQFTMPRIVLLSAVACAAALLFPAVFSSDVYAYAGYGDMALHGINPYAHARITVRDALLDAMLWQWGNPPPMCVYGPAFVALAQAVVALFAPLGPAAPLWALRVIACTTLVLCAPLAYGAFSAFPRATRLAAAAGVALNPVAIWTAAEGHNDTLALAVVLAGFTLTARSRVFAGTLAVALSALVKAPGAIAAIAYAAASWPDRSRFRAAGAGAALGLAIAAASALPLEYGVRAHLAPHGRYFPQFSLQYVSVELAIAVGVALLVCARLSTPRIALPFAVFAAWIAIPNPYPWYAVWLLPVAFVAWRSYASWALIAASLLIALRYAAEATTDLSRPVSIAIVALEFGLPLMLLSAHMASERLARREIRTPGPDFAPHRSA